MTSDIMIFIANKIQSESKSNTQDQRQPWSTATSPIRVVPKYDMMCSTSTISCSSIRDASCRTRHLVDVPRVCECRDSGLMRRRKGSSFSTNMNTFTACVSGIEWTLMDMATADDDTHEMDKERTHQAESTRKIEGNQISNALTTVCQDMTWYA